MTRLSEQLRYFVNMKITEDSNWRDIQVVLFGHEVSGEGGHKIMEYIRLSRAQPNYHPNVRRCLYGLDADLVMILILFVARRGEVQSFEEEGQQQVELCLFCSVYLGNRCSLSPIESGSYQLLSTTSFSYARIPRPGIPLERVSSRARY